MPVYKLLEEMPYDEFLQWTMYFEQRPVGWRDDLRTAQLMRIHGDKRQPQEIFPSIAAIFNKRYNNPAESLKSSKMFQKMLSSKNGDKLKFMENL